MSTIYNLEPPTKGKVVLKTTLGDIDIELWPKEAPKAVRNFIQLCMEGYYCGTIFHRVIKDFMIQGGDPTGTGKGGESIFGAPFKDEIHSRLRFTHRGIVACANENEAHSNGSQFFITLEACQHLDKKHTIFGKVVGDSIYNVAHFNDLHTDDDDRPAEPPTLLDAEILWNPFEDIVPRITKEEREAEASAKREREAEEQQRAKKKRRKNLGLLSFGEEAGEEDAEAAAIANATKMRSAFDHAEEDDPRLVKSGTELAEVLAAQEVAEEAERKRLRASVRAALARPEETSDGVSEDERIGSGKLASTSAVGEAEEGDFAARMRAAALAKRKEHGEPLKTLQAGNAAGEEEDDDDAEPVEGAAGRQRKSKNVRDRQKEALAAGRIKPAREKPSKLFARQDTNLLSEFEKKRLEAKERSLLSKEKGNNLAKLMAFKSKLRSGQVPSTSVTADSEGNTRPAEKDQDASLPAAWRIDRFLDDYEDEKLDSLVQHKLEFAKDVAKRDTMTTNNDDDYKVEDPLADRNETWNRKEGAAKRRNSDWRAGMEGPLD